MPIGMASAVGRTEGGLAVWQLTIDGADVPGRGVIIDCRFVLVERAPARDRSGLRQGRPGPRRMDETVATPLLRRPAPGSRRSPPAIAWGR
jgi:hypothetical protein